MSQEPLLSIRSLGRKIHSKWLWKNLSFQIFTGERIGLVGPSGSGKTTLLKALVGLEDIEEGTILFQGKEIKEWYMPLYRSHVLYLHQKTPLLEGTVEENLQYIFQFSQYRSLRYDRKNILRLLSFWGKTTDFLQFQTTKLSGGEIQIVSLLRALQLSPKILLLDEPTASLDKRTQQKTEEIIQHWKSEKPGRTYIWISHQSEQINRVTERKILLR